MQDSALQAIAAKAGQRLPIMRGKDRGLPQQAPVFDIALLREKNAETILRRMKKADAGV